MSNKTCKAQIVSDRIDKNNVLNGRREQLQK